jgi:hypothetical protein
MVSNRRFLANIFVPLDLQLILDGSNRQFLRPPLAPVATPAATPLRRLKPGQEGDPSSRKALLRMTAKCGLDARTVRLGEADRSRWTDVFARVFIRRVRWCWWWGWGAGLWGRLLVGG